MMPVDDLIRGVPDSISAIEGYFEKVCENAARDLLIEKSAAAIVARGGQVELGGFAVTAGISIRQWERRFLDTVGLPPKTFSRIQRFQRVLRESAGQAGWADAALRCGYYDQAHLIRDFRDFTGDTPTHLTRQGPIWRGRCRIFPRRDRINKVGFEI
ncbi:MAG: helix-turn-helix domain-containing protein [Acidobacteriota bacterium]